MQTSRQTTTVLLLILCVFFWGSVFPVAKIILTDMSNVSLAVLRFIISIAGLGIYCLLTREKWPTLTIQHYLALTLLGIIGIGGFNMGLFSGLKTTTPTNGALIMALSPLTTTLLSALMAGKLPALKQGISLLVSLLGVCIVITHGHLSQLVKLQINQGDLYIMAAMLTWCCYTLFSQRMMTVMSPIMFTLITMITGTLALLVICLTSQVSPMTEMLQLPAFSLILLLYISIFATVLGYLFWINGVKHLGAARTSVFYNLLPVFAALVSYLFGQPLTLDQILGIVVVLAGLSISKLNLNFLRQPQREI